MNSSKLNYIGLASFTENVIIFPFVLRHTNQGKPSFYEKAESVQFLENILLVLLIHFVGVPKEP